jgi:hypothetical protein
MCVRAPVLPGVGFWSCATVCRCGVASTFGLRTGAVRKFLGGVGVVEVRLVVGIVRQLGCGESPWFGVLFWRDSKICPQCKCEPRDRQALQTLDRSQ